MPERFQTLYALNPLVGVIQGFRWALFGGPSPWHLMIASTLIAVAIFAGGLFYFRKAEDAFSDLV